MARIAVIGSLNMDLVVRAPRIPELGETILGTPSLDDGAIYFRSDGHLWKVGK